MQNNRQDENSPNKKENNNVAINQALYPNDFEEKKVTASNINNSANNSSLANGLNLDMLIPLLNGNKNGGTADLLKNLMPNSGGLGNIMSLLGTKNKRSKISNEEAEFCSEKKFENIIDAEDYYNKQKDN